jgi:hypothetical protein
MKFGYSMLVTLPLAITIHILASFLGHERGLANINWVVGIYSPNSKLIDQ